MTTTTKVTVTDILGTSLTDSQARGVPIQGKLGSGDITTDAWGAQKISVPKSLFHGLFTFDIPPSMWFTYHNGVQVYTSTNITSANSAGKLITDVVNTTVKLESRECPRYQPNRGHLFSTALWCPTKTADGIRDWGMINDHNGVFFRLKADGLLYAVRKSGNVEVQEEVIDTSNIAGFDVQKGNVYDIQYQWRGVGNYKFYINLTLVHTFNLLGTLTALSMENPALPIGFVCTRMTQDVEMHIGCADVSSENGLTDTEQYGSCYAEGIVAVTNTPIIVVKSPLLVGAKTNTRTVTLARISFNASKKATFKVWMTRDPTAITGATFVANGGGSYIESDSVAMNATAVKATAVNTALLRIITAVPVEALVPRVVDNPYRGRIEFPLVRGDYLVITATGTSPSCDVVVEFGEQI